MIVMISVTADLNLYKIYKRLIILKLYTFFFFSGIVVVLHIIAKQCRYLIYDMSSAAVQPIGVSSFVTTLSPCGQTLLLHVRIGLLLFFSSGIGILDVLKLKFPVHLLRSFKSCKLKCRKIIYLFCESDLPECTLQEIKSHLDLVQMITRQQFPSSVFLLCLLTCGCDVNLGSGLLCSSRLRLESCRRTAVPVEVLLKAHFWTGPWLSSCFQPLDVQM